MTLVEALAHALGIGKLEELVAVVASAPEPELARRASDVVFCWWVRGLAPPAEVVARVRAALPGASEADRASVAAMLGEPFELPAEPDLPWEKLGPWASDMSALALPGVEHGLLAGLEDELWRAAGLALLLQNAPVGASILRWLAFRLPPKERPLAEGLIGALKIARERNEGIVETLAAFAVHHRAKERPRPAQRAARVHVTAPVARERLRPLVDGAIGWLEKSADRFTTAPTDALSAMMHHKAIGELALVAERLGFAGERQGVAAWRRKSKSLLELAIAQLGDGAGLVEMIETAPHLAAMVTILPPFQRAGAPITALRDVCVRHAGSAAREVAYLVARALRELGAPTPWDLETAWGWTRVASQPAPWRMSLAELYLPLHEIWHRAEDPWPEDDPARRYVERWLPVWMRHLALVGQHDLLAEVLIAWHAVLRQPAPAFAWETLLAAQRPDGAIPPGGGEGILPDEYHATLGCIWAVATHP